MLKITIHIFTSRINYFKLFRYLKYYYFVLVPPIKIIQGFNVVGRDEQNRDNRLYTY